MVGVRDGEGPPKEPAVVRKADTGEGLFRRVLEMEKAPPEPSPF